MWLWMNFGNSDLLIRVIKKLFTFLMQTVWSNLSLTTCPLVISVKQFYISFTASEALIFYDALKIKSHDWSNNFKLKF